ncbi:hypothetical protein NEFER03_1903 [Nematocida sp. LUAm3]|nr:hypothetical protein NEFER03_1903 [Nematocida sp. LUAm3]KAI5173946.1 hypothetical protein NEFER02_0413 [Nematocida sp. LUAm2]KAI5177309.1 hypothetical protein NEFER01_0584 [Nematocida sp. LUAm1]
MKILGDKKENTIRCAMFLIFLWQIQYCICAEATNQSKKNPSQKIEGFKEQPPKEVAMKQYEQTLRARDSKFVVLEKRFYTKRIMDYIVLCKLMEIPQDIVLDCSEAAWSELVRGRLFKEYCRIVMYDVGVYIEKEAELEKIKSQGSNVRVEDVMGITTPWRIKCFSNSDGQKILVKYFIAAHKYMLLLQEEITDRMHKHDIYNVPICDVLSILSKVLDKTKTEEENLLKIIKTPIMRGQDFIMESFYRFYELLNNPVKNEHIINQTQRNLKDTYHIINMLCYKNKIVSGEKFCEKYPNGLVEIKLIQWIKNEENPGPGNYKISAEYSFYAKEIQEAICLKKDEPLYMEMYNRIVDLRELREEIEQNVTPLKDLKNDWKSEERMLRKHFRVYISRIINEIVKLENEEVEYSEFEAEMYMNYDDIKKKLKSHNPNDPAIGIKSQEDSDEESSADDSDDNNSTYSV